MRGKKASHEWCNRILERGRAAPVCLIYTLYQKLKPTQRFSPRISRLNDSNMVLIRARGFTTLRTCPSLGPVYLQHLLHGYNLNIVFNLRYCFYQAKSPWFFLFILSFSISENKRLVKKTLVHLVHLIILRTQQIVAHHC